MADDRRRDEWESSETAEQEKDRETTAPPTAAEQKDVQDVIADELNDDRFQASNN